MLELNSFGKKSTLVLNCNSDNGLLIYLRHGAEANDILMLRLFTAFPHTLKLLLIDLYLRVSRQ